MIFKNAKEMGNFYHDLFALHALAALEDESFEFTRDVAFTHLSNMFNTDTLELITETLYS